MRQMLQVAHTSRSASGQRNTKVNQGNASVNWKFDPVRFTSCLREKNAKAWRLRTSPACTIRGALSTPTGLGLSCLCQNRAKSRILHRCSFAMAVEIGSETLQPQMLANFSTISIQSRCKNGGQILKMSGFVDPSSALEPLTG